MKGSWFGLASATISTKLGMGVVSRLQLPRLLGSIYDAGILNVVMYLDAALIRLDNRVSFVDFSMEAGLGPTYTDMEGAGQVLDLVARKNDDRLGTIA